MASFADGTITTQRALGLGRMTEVLSVKGARQRSERVAERTGVKTTITGGTVAAALTAAPALVGAPFTAWLTNALGLMSPSRRILCAGAFVCSVASTAATQLLKSQNLEEYVSRAEGYKPFLDGV